MTHSTMHAPELSMQFSIVFNCIILIIFSLSSGRHFAGADFLFLEWPWLRGFAAAQSSQCIIIQRVFAVLLSSASLQCC
ncbi:hypothetical protein B0T26DRAFT_731057 [Lasiosphaeria miniovina]|uniref:Uncharacterized protein n=1 Tax=Lasiosphaeria miniovina TaxID=1954250 RepID=A0AA40DJ83_9PEZI|nr:uncharacterized protein B0T26DRAFT_731057 [Lasiosphaeria miniovina]KAK0703356.1 hypothetical protein B0T26DRAFT_731057 [Lasiosphaeria miniovina]